MPRYMYIPLVLAEINVKWWWVIFNVTCINNLSFPANNVIKEDCIFQHCDIFWFERLTCQSSFTFHVILSKTVRFLFQIFLKVAIWWQFLIVKILIKISKCWIIQRINISPFTWNQAWHLMVSIMNWATFRCLWRTFNNAIYCLYINI